MAMIFTIMIMMFVMLVLYFGSGLTRVLFRILTPIMQIKFDDTLSFANSQLRDSTLFRLKNN